MAALCDGGPQSTNQLIILAQAVIQNPSIYHQLTTSTY